VRIAGFSIFKFNIRRRRTRTRSARKRGYEPRADRGLLHLQIQHPAGGGSERAAPASADTGRVRIAGFSIFTFNIPPCVELSRRGLERSAQTRSTWNAFHSAGSIRLDDASGPLLSLYRL